MNAMIYKSGILRTGVVHMHRPCPSLFYFPGLRSMPIWKPEDRVGDKHFAWVKDIENNIDIIRQEYDVRKLH